MKRSKDAVPFGCSDLTGHLTLSIGELRSLIPIFPDPDNIQGFTRSLLREVDPALFQGPNPVLSLNLQGRDSAASETPDLTVIFRNEARPSVLTIAVHTDPQPERDHTGTFQMTYEKPNPDGTLRTITIKGATRKTPSGTTVEFMPPGSGRNPGDEGAKLVTGANLRIIAQTFEPKP